MDPKVYPNPTQWNPYRWMSPDFVFQKTHFFPFSVGSRNCIGKGFAMTEMRLAISRTIIDFELEECQDEKLRASWEITQYLTVHLADGRYFVTMKKRSEA
jgi:cytochrome P450